MTSNHKNLYTTGQVAKICKCAPRTVSKWFDAGVIKGYRIPGRDGCDGDRRVPAGELVRFMKKHKIPTQGTEFDRECRVLIVGADAATQGALCSSMSDPDTFRVEAVATAFEAGIAIERLRTNVVIIDTAIGRIETLQIVNAIENDSTHSVALILSLEAGRITTDLREGDKLLNSLTPDETATFVADYIQERNRDDAWTA